MATIQGVPPVPRTARGVALTIIRLRGTQNLNPKTKDTLKYMRLNRVNHAVVLLESETTKGMLQVAKDYVTWGEVDAQTLASVIETRGRIVGDKQLTEAHLAKNTPYKTYLALAEAIVAGKFAYNKVPEIKPIFRLHPAKNGLEGIKRSVQNGGALGYRGTSINKLLGKMITSPEETLVAARPAAPAPKAKTTKAGA